MRIDHFGDSMCFTYPKDRQKSHQVHFCSIDIKCTDVTEKLSSTGTINAYVERLRDECCKFEFHLEGTYNLAEDRNISNETYTASRPRSWERLFNILFPHQTKSVNSQCNCEYDT